MLSKSRFMAGSQCLKRLYLDVYQPELAAGPDELAVAVQRYGEEVGQLARETFPGGMLVEGGPHELPAAIARTAELVRDASVPAIFEAAFQQEDIRVRVDILERLPEGRWRLIEVKSSTDLKEHYLYDVAVQRHVISRAGLENSPCLMHLNRDYVYDGYRYEMEKLFTIRDLTEQVAALEQEVARRLQEQREVLSQPAPPAIAPGPQCTKPQTCEFYDHCNSPLPDDHVSRLPGISSAKVAQLLDQGIDSIGKIPPEFPLSFRQRRARQVVQSQTMYIGEELARDLRRLDHPLYFMDFETFSPPIPQYAGMRPYSHIPFQWSLHLQKQPGAEPEHFEFIAEDRLDPRRAFLKSLIKAVDQQGHIIVYNRSFESQRLAELATWLPEYTDAVANIQNRLWDLLDVVRRNVYHPQFMGSFSLKRVLPALIPDMSYDTMEVSQGTEAGLAWERMTRGQISAAEKSQLRQALHAYGCQDTLAMVRLVEFLAAAS